MVLLLMEALLPLPPAPPSSVRNRATLDRDETEITCDCAERLLLEMVLFIIVALSTKADRPVPEFPEIVLFRIAAEV